MPIEMHSESVYTREMHERFVKELYESGMFTIVDRSTNEQRFKVVHNKELGCTSSREYEVFLTGKEKITCSCGLYEHSGLPCRHSLKVGTWFRFVFP